MKRPLHAITACLLLACGPPSSGGPPVGAEAPRETGARHAAIYGDAGLDPRLDPSIFEVEKPNEADARRVAKDRCGQAYELIGGRAVSRTTAGSCSENPLTQIAKTLETTRSSGSTKTCSPGSESSGTLYRFRCVGR